MALDLTQLESLIDTPDKAQRVKSILDSTDPNSLSPEDRAAYVMTRNAMKRWTNPSGGMYATPRAPGDVVSQLSARGVTTPATPDDIKYNRPTVGQHVREGAKSVLSLVGMPMSSNPDQWFASDEEATAMMEAKMKAANENAVPLGDLSGLVKQVPSVVSRTASGITGPARAYIEGRDTTPEESLNATRSAAPVVALLSAVPKSVRQAEVPGNRVLDPVRTVRRADAKAGNAVNKARTKIDRKYKPELVENARTLADSAELQRQELGNKVAGPPTTQAEVFDIMRSSDQVVGTAREATKMAKREQLYNRNIPNDITERLAPHVDDMPSRLKRGDNVGKTVYDKYKETGIPDNPELIKGDKLAVYERTQARLQEPDMMFDVPDEVIINSIADDAMRKMVAPIGDAPTINPVLRDIVDNYRKNGTISPEDYATLRDMATGKYITGYDTKGEPVMGSVPMPQALSETVGYIERLRRDFGGRLPNKPRELNQVKAERYQEINDRAFAKEATEADKSLVGIHRGQAAGLRKLVDEITAGPDGRSPIAELNEQYANLSTLEEGMRNYDVSTQIKNPVPPMMISGSNVNPVKAGITGTGIASLMPRAVRDWIRKPNTGITIANARAGAGKLRGLEPPPTKPPASGPVGPPNFSTSGGSFTPRPAPPPPPKQSPPAKAGKATAAVKAPATAPDYEALGREAFTYARDGNLRKLESLWFKHGTQLRKTMRSSDVAWVEEKLKRRSTNNPTDQVRKPPTRAEQQAADAKRVDSLASEVVDDALKNGANRVLKETTSTSKRTVAPPPPANFPKSAAEALGESPRAAATPVNKGDWREVKQVNKVAPEAPKPMATEKPTGQVSTDTPYFDDLELPALEAKIKELDTVHANASKRGNNALAERTDTLRKEVNRVLDDRRTGKPPVPKPSLDDELSKFDDPEFENLTDEKLDQMHKEWEFGELATEGATPFETARLKATAEYDKILPRRDALLNPDPGKIYPIDSLFDKTATAENLKKGNQIYHLFDDAREQLRAEVGPTVRVYRYETPNEPKLPNKTTLHWSLDRDQVEEFNVDRLDESGNFNKRVLRTEEIPVDDIVALPKYKSKIKTRNGTDVAVDMAEEVIALNRESKLIAAEYLIKKSSPNTGAINKSTAPSPSPEIQALIDKAVRMQNAGDVEGANKILKSALAKAEKSIKPKVAKPPKATLKPAKTPGSDPRTEPQVEYSSPGGLQKYKSHSGVMKGGKIRADGYTLEVLDITGFPDGRVIVKTPRGSYPVDKVKPTD